MDNSSFDMHPYWIKACSIYNSGLYNCSQVLILAANDVYR